LRPCTWMTWMGRRCLRPAVPAGALLLAVVNTFARAQCCAPMESARAAVIGVRADRGPIMDGTLRDSLWVNGAKVSKVC
jgi:hypothetical protein